MTGTTSSVIADVAEQQARSEQVEVLAVELKGEGSRQLVRVIVDRKGGVGLDVCERISRQMSRKLDALDPIGGRYTLEVTSPGLDWPLTDQASFDRVEGRDVLIHRRGSGDSVEQLRGRVTRARPDGVELDRGGDAIVVTYETIVKATQALPW